MKWLPSLIYHPPPDTDAEARQRERDMRRRIAEQRIVRAQEIRDIVEQCRGRFDG